MPLTEKELAAKEATRDLGAELLEAVQNMVAGNAARMTKVAISPVVEARNKVGLSQAAFAELLGVSPRTLQDWEQGRRTPTGAAQTLLRVAVQHPEALRDLRSA